MAVQKVAIVDRPNIGRSSLFNGMARKMIAIVDGTAGTARDRMRHLMHEGDRYFEIVDTGGMGIEDSDDPTEDIENQIHLGLAEADLLVFVVAGECRAHLYFWPAGEICRRNQRFAGRWPAWFSDRRQSSRC